MKILKVLFVLVIFLLSSSIVRAEEPGSRIIVPKDGRFIGDVITLRLIFKDQTITVQTKPHQELIIEIPEPNNPDRTKMYSLVFYPVDKDNQRIEDYEKFNFSPQFIGLDLACVENIPSSNDNGICSSRKKYSWSQKDRPISLVWSIIPISRMLTIPPVNNIQVEFLNYSKGIARQDILESNLGRICKELDNDVRICTYKFPDFEGEI